MTSGIQSGGDIVYTKWRSFIQGVTAPGDIPYTEIMAKRFETLNGWAKSQPNGHELKTLLGRIGDAPTPKDRIMRASRLLEICKPLEKNPLIRDLLIDQAQDDLNIAFDQAYLLNPEGEDGYDSTLFDGFVNGYDLLNQWDRKPRFEALREPTKYYFIATTVTSLNCEQCKRVALVLAKASCDLVYVKIFQTYAATNDNKATSKSLNELAERYQTLFSSSAISLSDQVHIRERIAECKKFAFAMELVDMSPVAKRELASLRPRIDEIINSKRGKKSSEYSRITRLFICAIAGLLMIAVFLYRKHRAAG